MDIEMCPKCGENHLNNENCKDKYNVYSEHYNNKEVVNIRANSHEEASLLFNEKYNQSSDDIIIIVEHEEQGVKRFKVVNKTELDYIVEYYE